MKPHTQVTQNTAAFVSEPMITPTGFREYDARWKFPEQINLSGIQALGLGLATQLHEMGLPPRIVVGQDYRAYSQSIKQALIVGLMSGGIEVHDIGLALSPLAYFAQFELGITAVAMVTASHNPNGWTGVKIGAHPPLTHGPDEMERLKQIVLSGEGKLRAGGAYQPVEGLVPRYLKDLSRGFRLNRPLKVICACGNGTAGAFAPQILADIGAQVIPLHTSLDYTFPHYNPNPESMQMLHDMAQAVRLHGADLAVGFDGDGDRCGVVDNHGEEVFADEMGVILARDWSHQHPGAQFVADIKSTALFVTDPVLAQNGAKTDYWKTGHSHMKRRVKELGALAGFEKSGHYFLAEPIGRGYDDGLRVAVEICKLLDRGGNKTLSAFRAELSKSWASPTMSPFCSDESKYGVSARLTDMLQQMAARGEKLAGQTIEQVITINGARVMLQGGGWGLIRPSSNTPNLVVVCESPHSLDDMKAIFHGLDALIQTCPEVGDYDQRVD